jgi:glutathione S-transferase
MSYYQQIEEAKPHIAWFENERLPRFMQYLEKVLTFNVEKANNNGGFFLGNSLTYVDVAMFHVIEAAASQFPEAYEKAIATMPRIVAFREQFRAIPRVADYLASDRRGFFEGNSMM